MTDSEEKKPTVSVRIYEETQTVLLREQAKRKRPGQKKPPFADLIEEAWSAHSGTDSTGTIPTSTPLNQGSLLIDIPPDLSEDMASRLRESSNNLVRLFTFAEEGDEFLDLAEMTLKTCADAVEGQANSGPPGNQAEISNRRHHKDGVGRASKSRKTFIQDKKAV